MRGDVVLLARSEVKRVQSHVLDDITGDLSVQSLALERPRGNARESRVSPAPAQPGAPLDSCVA